MAGVFTKPYDLSDSPTLQHYLMDFHTPFCGVMSHVNSGKTTAMVMKSQLVAANQHPDVNGIRQSSHLFIRGTHGDLLRGIVRTFEERISTKLVPIRKSPPVTGTLKMQPLYDMNNHFPKFMYFNGKQHPYCLGGWDPEAEEYYPGSEDVSGVRIGDVFQNGTMVNALFDFVPLDNPDWEAMLLGTNYTSAYFDEPDSMSNIEDVLTKLPTRLGRFPPAEIAPLTSTQVNMAYNPPPRDSFTEEFFDPKYAHLGRKLYRVQPPFLMIPDPDEPSNFFKAEFIRNPQAEGVKYAAKGFQHWQDLIDANRHNPNKIRRDVLGEYTHGTGGELVHKTFVRDYHVVPEIRANKSRKLFCSCDWGNAGAAIFAQFSEGAVQVLEEMSADGVMSHQFVKEQVIPHLNSEYRGYDIIITGDPSGAYKRDVGEGPMTIFSDMGFLVEDELSNDPQERWTAVNYFLNVRDGLKISAEGCPMLIKGFEGEYVFKQQKDGVTLQQVDKRKHHSAFQDCLQAVCQLVHGGYETASSSITDRFRSQEDAGEPEDDFLWA